MKVSVLRPDALPVLPDDFGERYESWVTTPWSLVDDDEVHASFRDALDQLMLGARLGFDGLGVTEHGQSSYDMVPNPSLMASALAYATDVEGLDVAIYPVGRSLGKSKEPLRVAEEMAMIDTISGGRLVARGHWPRWRNSPTADPPRSPPRARCSASEQPHHSSRQRPMSAASPPVSGGDSPRSREPSRMTGTLACRTATKGTGAPWSLARSGVQSRQGAPVVYW